jgi:ABC-type polysaccharide/polyol phosphate export permease
MTHIIKATRDILIGNQFPQLQGLMYVLIISFIIFVIGINIFKSREKYFVEKI